MSAGREAIAFLDYGPPITLAAAKTCATAAEAEALENGWRVTIAILDSGGNLVLLHRMDNADIDRPTFAQRKARTAVSFRRDTKLLENMITEGQLRFLGVEGVLMLEGGLPLIAGGKVVGAIGISGVRSVEDAQVARAGAAAL